MKLDKARINHLLNYINNVWNIEECTTNSIIINVFKKAGIIGNSYISKDEEKDGKGIMYYEDGNYEGEFKKEKKE